MTNNQGTVLPEPPETEEVSVKTAKSLATPGIAVTAMGMMNPGAFANLASGLPASLKDTFQKFSLGGLAAGLGEMVMGIVQKLVDFVKNTDHVKALGNDGGTLVRDFSNMTGANPRVTEISPNGQERNLGPARQIGMDNERQPIVGSNNPGFNTTAKISQPSLAMN